MSRALVICIGNDLVGDDGVGHAIYYALKKKSLPSGTRLKLLGLGGMNLLDEIEGEKLLVVVDAVQFGDPPGTVHTLNWNQIPRLEPRAVSGHGIGVREAIEVSRCLYPEKTPHHIYLVGVEGRTFDQLGSGLSREVADAVGKATTEVLRLLGIG